MIINTYCKHCRYYKYFQQSCRGRPTGDAAGEGHVSLLLHTGLLTRSLVDAQGYVFGMGGGGALVSHIVRGRKVSVLMYLPQYYSTYVPGGARCHTTAIIIYIISLHLFLFFYSRFLLAFCALTLNSRWEGIFGSALS